MVISLIYTLPFLTVERNGRIVRHCLVRLVMKLVLAQFCMEKDHEIMNEGTECVR